MTVLSGACRDEDDRLLDRAQPTPGADEPIARLIRQHGAVLFRFLLRLTNGDRERSEDIYQETLLRVCRHQECCPERVFSGPQWMFTVARRVSIDQLRAAAARPMTFNGDRHLAVVPDPVDYFDRMLLGQEVRAALRMLSTSHREVLREIYFEDRPMAQVAKRLAVPEGTVKSRTYYALRALKDSLEERGLDRGLALGASDDKGSGHEG